MDFLEILKYELQIVWSPMCSLKLYEARDFCAFCKFLIYLFIRGK